MPTLYGGTQPTRLSIFWSLDGQIAMVDRWLAPFGVIGTALWSSSDLFGAFSVTGLNGLVLSCCSSDAKFEGYKLYRKTLTDLPLLAQSQVGAANCNGGVAWLPTQCAGLMSWKSPIGGKQGRGRDYFPFPWKDAVNSLGRCSPGYISSLSDIGIVMQAGWTIPNIAQPGVNLTLYPCTKYVLPSTLMPFQLNDFQIAAGFATQRRRGFFGRLNRAPFG